MGMTIDCGCNGISKLSVMAWKWTISFWSKNHQTTKPIVGDKSQSVCYYRTVLFDELTWFWWINMRLILRQHRVQSTSETTWFYSWFSSVFDGVFFFIISLRFSFQSIKSVFFLYLNSFSEPKFFFLLKLISFSLTLFIRQ